MGELLTLMKADEGRLASFVPEMMLIWSEIILRVVWQGAKDIGAVERARRTVNARMARFVQNRAGEVVCHRQLEGDNFCLMRPDRVHLTDIGLDTFLSGIQDEVEQALFPNPAELGYVEF